MRSYGYLSGSLIIACLLSWNGTAAQPQPLETKSALESNPEGWMDLLAEIDFAGWKRVSIPPGSKLKDKSPWKIDLASKTIICDGVGYHEMLLFDKVLDDGIFHVEWRFKKIEDKKGYNSGVYARNSADGKIWHQAQVGNKNVGFLFGDTLVNGEKKRVKIPMVGPQRGKEPGEWNTYEITCKGKTMTLWVNGAVTCVWDSCEVPSGYVGLEAEGWFIEFKNLKYKPLKK